jgi:hypothetical protein
MKNRLGTRVLVTAAMVLGSSLSAAPAGEPVAATQPAKVLPEIAPDPEVARILGSLGAGQAAELPAAKVTGDLNEVAKRYNLDKKGPGGRNFCVEMLWMADRRRAIYLGANHGSPHRLNDVWEYDLQGNTWVCLYGPDDLSKGSATFAQAEFKDGALVTPRGGPVVMGHQWCQSTYDPITGTMYFNSQWPLGFFPPNIQEKMKSAANLHHPPLWSFRPAEGRWRPVRTPGGPVPAAGVRQSGQNRYLQFVPELKGLLFANAGDGMGTWQFCFETRLWKELLPGDDASKKANFNPNLPFRVGMKGWCQDKGVLVVCSEDQKLGNRTVEYDVAANKWSKTAEGPDTPGGHPSFTPGGYDPGSGTFLLYDQREQSLALWAYDVAGKKWQKIKPAGAAAPVGGGSNKLIGYFDPERNVFVLCRDTYVWVYRHRAR